MKTLAHIVALHVFLASALPCCPVEECEAEDTEGTHAAMMGDECGGSELCSPFFLCKSCAGCGFTSLGVDDASKLLPVSQSPLPDAPALSSLLDDGIWRPPKIS